MKKIDDYENSDLQEMYIAALRLSDKMVENDERGKEELFNTLKKYLTEKELVELTMCIGIFMGVGRMNRFIDLEF